MLCNNASGQKKHQPSGPEFGRTAPGKEPKGALWPAAGRPGGRFRCFPGSGPAKIRPGKPISGPEVPLRNIDWVPRALVTDPQYWSVVDAIWGCFWGQCGSVCGPMLASFSSSFGVCLAQPFLF